MAVKAMANIKVETEGDLQVLYFTLPTVADADTTSVAAFFKLPMRSIEAIASTSAAVGATHAAGVITWKISSGTPNLICRVAGGA